MNQLRVSAIELVNNDCHSDTRKYQKHKKEEGKKEPQNSLQKAPINTVNPDCTENHYNSDGSLLSPTQTSCFSFKD